MGSSTGKLYNMIDVPKPIVKYHAMNRICMLISILGYTSIQLIMGILRRFAERKSTITLFFILTTWVLLFDGQRRDDAAIPFQSYVECGNTVMGITRRDSGPECFRLVGHYRPECLLPERDLLCNDGLNFGCLRLHSCFGLPYSCALSFFSHDMIELF
jgi:hypothetical protein